MSQKCQYRINGQCALLSRDFDLDSCEARLMHIINCNEEIIRLQSEVIHELFNLTGQNAAVGAEEMESIIEKINEAARIKAEV